MILMSDERCVMRQKVKVQEKTSQPVAKAECNHYWIIEMANGSKSRGVCQYCGETRDFFNSISAYNEIKRNTHPLDLPKMPKVKVDEDSKS